jgi:capsular polysaccharide biosynthesis protein
MSSGKSIERIYDILLDKSISLDEALLKINELNSKTLGKQFTDKLLHLLKKNTDASTRIRALETLLKISNNDHIKFQLALQYRITGKNEQSLKCFSELCVNSKNVWHFIEYATGLVKANRIGQALDILSKAQKLDHSEQQEAIINKNFAEAFTKSGNKVKAIKHYLLFLKDQPGDTKTYFNIANIISHWIRNKHTLDYIKTQRDVPYNILKEYFPEVGFWNKLEVNSNSENVTWYSDRYKRTLDLPKGINDELHYSLEGSREVHSWESFIIELNNAQCAANESFSYVEDANRNIIDTVSIGGSNILRAFKKFDKSYRLNGNVAFISQYFGAVNYCHWLLDILPRVGLLEKCGYDLDKIDYFIFNNYKSKFQKDSLNRLGIEKDRIITSGEYPEIRAQKLLVPSLHMHPGNSGSPWVAQFLQDKFLESQSSKKRRIYINRMGVDKRRVINEMELIDMLEKKFGFENITMHEHDVFEQAKIANEAEIIVGPHGAALTNIVFCRPGTKFVEIFSPVYGTWTYFITARMAELDYHNFIGEDFDNSLSVFDTQKYPNSYFGQKDIMVNIPKLESLLGKIIY